MPILHIIRNLNDPLPLDILRRQQEDGNEVAVLFIHDAVLCLPDLDVPVYACEDDVKARGVVISSPCLSYDEIVDMLFEYDSITVW
jgi:sulfur transfer complex TusBCD TusB component (DsrH family)